MVTVQAVGNVVKCTQVQRKHGGEANEPNQRMWYAQEMKADVNKERKRRIKNRSEERVKECNVFFFSPMGNGTDRHHPSFDIISVVVRCSSARARGARLHARAARAAKAMR